MNYESVIQLFNHSVIVFRVNQYVKERLFGYYP